MNGSPCARKGYASLNLCLRIRICHSIIHVHPNVKYQRNQANINNVLCIQNSLSHIHWPFFEDEKEESVEIGCVIIKKMRVVLKCFP